MSPKDNSYHKYIFIWGYNTTLAKVELPVQVRFVLTSKYQSLLIQVIIYKPY